MKSQKTLLVFAHPGEAQSFLKEYSFKEIPEIIPNLYEDSECFLLISGEGRQAVTERLAFVIGALSNKIDKVINLGIAGAIDSKYEVGEIISLRTAYQEMDSQKMEFKSFTSNDPAALTDIVTANQRVLNEEYAKRLSCFAPIADRELWAIASVCNQFNLPWYSYKYISDVAGKEQELCQRLKDKALEFSNALLQYYQNNIATVQESYHQDNIDWELPFDIYLTKTQTHQFQGMMDKLVKKYGSLENVLDKIDYEDILGSSLRPKEKTKLIINQMKELLSPFEGAIKRRIQQSLSPLKQANIKTHIDPHFESKKLQLTIEICDSKDIYRLQDSLNQFNYKEFESIFEGEIDV